ncbi:MAG: hypothetical protein ACREPF_02695 [Rhodanobacteraceae bacterium]
MVILTHSWQLAVVCLLAGFLLARLLSRRQRGSSTPPRDDISEAEIDTEARAGRRIEAIRLTRQKYGYELRAPKADVDAHAARLDGR